MGGRGELMGKKRKERKKEKTHHSRAWIVAPAGMKYPL